MTPEQERDPPFPLALGVETWSQKRRCPDAGLISSYDFIVTESRLNVEFDRWGKGFSPPYRVGPSSPLGKNDSLHEGVHCCWLARHTPLEAHFQPVPENPKRLCVASANASECGC
jgi:hypothetical protein